MAEPVDRMEIALQAWAHWLTLGGSGDGFSSMSVLHPDWSPPSPGTTPTLKVGRSDSRHQAMHAAVKRLSKRLQATLFVHYCKRWPVVMQAEQLECAPATVHSRVRDAKRLLALDLGW